jgi:hypothetical protein
MTSNPFEDPNATLEDMQAQYAKDAGMLPEWAQEPDKPVMPELGLQDLRTVATDFASRAPHGNIFELLTNADKVLAYLKNGTLPNDGPTDPESL